MAFEVRREVFSIAEVAGNQRQIADDQALRMYLRRFCIGFIGADITDMRISKSDDLAGIGRISEDFLITTNSADLIKTPSREYSLTLFAY